MKPSFAAVTAALAVAIAAASFAEEKPETPQKGGGLVPLNEPPALSTSAVTTTVHVSERDSSHALEFKIDSDGKVTLHVTEFGDGTTGEEEHKYEADSLEAFKQAYPDVAEKWQIDHFLPQVRVQSMNSTWDDFDRLLEEQRKLFEQFRASPLQWRSSLPDRLRARVLPQERGPMLGIELAPIDEVLVSQLSLEPGVGVLVMSVRPGSLAETVGMQRFDIVLDLDGEPVTSSADFAQTVREHLAAKKPFNLGILRAGKPQKIQVQ